MNDVATSNPDGVSLVAGDNSSTAAVSYKVVGTGGDDDTGCNIDSSENLTISIDPPSGITANPSTLAFTDCGTFKAVTFSAGASAVSGDVTVSITGNTTGAGTYNLTPSSFPITVTQPPVPSDTTPPDISFVLNPTSADGSNDWYKGDVTLTWQVTENESPDSLVKTGCVDQNITADQFAVDYYCSATSDGGSTGPVKVTIKRDGTAPTIFGSRTPSANSKGWNNTDVTVTWTCTDATSGAVSDGSSQTLTGEGAGQSATYNCSDFAGNSIGDTQTDINIDKTAPTVSLVGGPANGATYYFGFVPPAPTCSASDGLSGLDGSCSVSGYSAAIGNHTTTASATDNAGNPASASATYTVLAWTRSGFYQPVDMGGVYNTVKGGSTVPLKFEVFAGSELTNISVVKSFVQTAIPCNGTSPTDEVEITTTGGTNLRYDTTGGQFIQNWQTPRSAGACYRVTLTTQDDMSLVAFFKLK